MTGAAERGPWGTWVMSLIYLGFYANMGVLTRVYLDRFVTLGCAATSWGPCWVGNNWPGGLYGLYTSVLVCYMFLVAAQPHAIPAIRAPSSPPPPPSQRSPTCLVASSLASYHLHNS